jgi:hypothetical protein
VARTPTEKQKKLAKAIIENAKKENPDNKGEVLASVGYSDKLAKANPTKIMEAEGVKKELANLGFSEEKARTVVGNILTNDDLDPNPRLKAADMVFKVFGTYASDKINPNAPQQIIINVLGNPEAKKLSEQMDKLLIKNLYEGEIINDVEKSSGQIGETNRQSDDNGKQS